MTPLEYSSSLDRPHNRELAKIIDSRYVLALLGARRVNAPLYNFLGKTALIHAAENNHVYAARLFVECYGARLDLCDNWGVNALYYAMRLRNVYLAGIKRGQYFEIAKNDTLDSVLHYLVGPLDPSEYEAEFPLAMESIRKTQAERTGEGRRESELFSKAIFTGTLPLAS